MGLIFGKYPGKAAYHGNVARNYDEDRMAEPLWDLEQRYLKLCVARWPQGTTILDLPIGTGRFVPIYLEYMHKILGVDVSPDMLAEVRRRYPQYEQFGNGLIVGDAERLSLQDDAVEFAVCWRLAHLVPLGVLQNILIELRRVAKRGVLLEVLGAQNGRRTLLTAIIAAVRRFRHRARASEPITPWSHIRSYAHYESELPKVFSRAGLRVEREDVLQCAGQSGIVYHLSRHE